MRGVIDRLELTGAFGFIRGEDGREFFFHQTGLTDVPFESLAAGSRVDFAVPEHAEGDEPGEDPRAVNVRLAEDQLPTPGNEPLPPEKTDGQP